jgi:putative glutamine amidotransferase
MLKLLISISIFIFTPVMAQAIMVKGPVIGISGGSPTSGSVNAMVKQIEDAGGTVIMLTNHTKRDAKADLAQIDALVVMGNNADIDPAAYGESPHPETYAETQTPEGAARADYENTILQEALDSKMPVMGVCAGMQRLNVLLGGSLHQHVPDITGHDEHAQQELGISFSTPVQPILIENDSKLGTIADEVRMVYAPSHEASSLPTIMMENSMHHQAVKDIGQGLRAVAFADDEITGPDGNKQRLVEAVEADPAGPYANQFVLGVQWHPEFGASPLGPKLANHVVAEAQHYAQTQNRQHSTEDVERENALSKAQDYAAPSPEKEKDTPRIRPGSAAAAIMQMRAQQQERGHTQGPNLQ